LRPAKDSQRRSHPGESRSKATAEGEVVKILGRCRYWFRRPDTAGDTTLTRELPACNAETH